MIRTTWEYTYIILKTEVSTKSQYLRPLWPGFVATPLYSGIHTYLAYKEQLSLECYPAFWTPVYWKIDDSSWTIGNWWYRIWHETPFHWNRAKMWSLSNTCRNLVVPNSPLQVTKNISTLPTQAFYLLTVSLVFMLWMEQPLFSPQNGWKTWLPKHFEKPCVCARLTCL